LSSCLAKARDDRFQTAHDVRLQLGGVAQASGSVAGTEVGQRKHRIPLAGVAGAAALLALGLGFWLGKASPRPSAGDSDITRLTVSLPAKRELAVDISQGVVLSPDG